MSIRYGVTTTGPEGAPVHLRMLGDGPLAPHEDFVWTHTDGNLSGQAVLGPGQTVLMTPVGFSGPKANALSDAEESLAVLILRLVAQEGTSRERAAWRARVQAYIDGL